LSKARLSDRLGMAAQVSAQSRQKAGDDERTGTFAAPQGPSHTRKLLMHAFVKLIWVNGGEMLVKSVR